MAFNGFVCAFVAFLAVGVVCNASAAERSGETAMTSKIVALDGEGWVLAADPENVGKDQQWWTQPTVDAKPARVPGIIQETVPRYHGVAWYWRTFDAPAHPDANGRYLLRFWAVDYLAQVWVNDVAVGGHEGGETPFVLDVTDAVKPGAPNRLAVRVLNPKKEPIDGIVLAETPHRNKGIPLTVGGSYNSGGITEPVELVLAPPVRMDDVFVRADWKSGKVSIATTVTNALPGETKASFSFVIVHADRVEQVASGTAESTVAPGANRVESSLDVPDRRLWNLDDPHLYRLTVNMKTPETLDTYSVRFGFRDFRVEKGYFRLNGKRIFLKSSHTGNHCPVGMILPPDQARDLLRKDLIYAKASGFNMVRFIAGIAHPYQLDLCDEIGLMVYEETLAGWLLGDSPKMAERFDLSIREMILRDRNHPSVTIWGMLNETNDGPVFRHAVDSLALVRSLDDTRLALLDSGRWDGAFNIGSASNPGSAQWECVWGVESPDFQGHAGGGPYGGYFTGAGDAHVYPSTPHTPEIEQGIRTLGSDSKPVFLSEYGIGSLMNAIRELRHYEQYGFNPDYEDFAYFRTTSEKLTADWTRYGMDGVYAFPEDMLHDSQALHCRQRLLGFNALRSNPKICGYNLTGLLDHGFTGEGLWSFWREWKPGIVDALQDGWAPLRWCAFVSPMHGYVNRPFKVEAVLANEDVLAPGAYPVTLRIVGPQGIAWERKTEAVVPEPAPGEDGPLAIPVSVDEVTLAGPAGAYEFAVSMDHGGAPLGGRLKFYVSDVGAVSPQPSMKAWGIGEAAEQWLARHGVACAPFDGAVQDAREIVLVGGIDANAEQRTALLRHIACGSTAIFLTPAAFRRGDDSTGWLPLKEKGRVNHFPDWLYHKECVAKVHPIFEGLQPKGVMDWDYYGPVISHDFIEGAELPEEVAAAAFAICHSGPPMGYASGVMVGAYRFGQGRFIVNTFNVLDHLDRHPAADRLLLNMIHYAAPDVSPPAPVPADFDVQAKAVGY